MLQTKRADFNAVAARFHISPVTARIIRNRDVEGEEAIDRYLNESMVDERLDAIDTADGVAACQSVRACSRHCPRGIDVGEEMWQIVARVRER